MIEKRFTDELGRIIECDNARIVGVDESVVKREMICKGSMWDIARTFDNSEWSLRALIGSLSAIQCRNFGEIEPDIESEYALFSLLINAAKDAEAHVATLRKLVFGHDGNSSDAVVTAPQVAAK